MEPEIEHLRDFVIAAHGDLEKTRQLLTDFPDLRDVGYEWSPEDRETAIQAASHMGNGEIAQYLLDQGAQYEIYTAAMLGRKADVEALLAEEPQRVNVAGAHAISLLTHAALSGDADLVAWLYGQGATSGVTGALQMAVYNQYYEVAAWLLENTAPRLDAEDFRGKTVWQVATERGDDQMRALLEQHGAHEPVRVESEPDA